MNSLAISPPSVNSNPPQVVTFAGRTIPTFDDSALWRGHLPRERVNLGRGMQWPLPGVSTEGLGIREGWNLGHWKHWDAAPPSRHDALASMLGRAMRQPSNWGKSETAAVALARMLNATFNRPLEGSRRAEVDTLARWVWAQVQQGLVSGNVQAGFSRRQSARARKRWGTGSHPPTPPIAFGIESGGTWWNGGGGQIRNGGIPFRMRHHSPSQTPLESLHVDLLRFLLWTLLRTGVGLDVAPVNWSPEERDSEQLMLKWR